MPLDVADTINKAADALLHAPGVHAIARNPIYTALLIVVVVILITMFVFRDIETEESVFTLSMRSGFWIFVMLIGILFVHNRVLAIETDTVHETERYGGVFADTVDTLESAVVPVRINTDFTL